MNELSLPQRRAGLHLLFTVGIVCSVVLYVTSLFLPAIGFGNPGTKNNATGAWLVLFGIFSLKETPAWLGNIPYIPGLVLGVIGIGTRQAPTHRWKRVVRFIALALFVLATLLGLATLRHLHIPIQYRYTSHRGMEQTLLQMRPGFYCWIGSFVVAGIVMLLALFERLGVQHQQADKP